MIKIMGLLAAILLMIGVNMSCSTRDGRNVVLIKDGRGEISMQLDRCAGGYWLYLEPVDFKLEKSDEVKNTVDIEIENRSSNKVIIFWGGVLISRNPYRRKNGTIELPLLGSKEVELDRPIFSAIG